MNAHLTPEQRAQKADAFVLAALWMLRRWAELRPDALGMPQVMEQIRRITGVREEDA